MNVLYLPEVHAWVLYAGILSLVASVILRSRKIFALEIVLLPGMMVLLEGWMLIITGLVQLIISVYLLFRLLHAIDRNYRLVLEKTHRIPRVITTKGADGGQSSFL
ncbi:hypothetical protein ACGTN9_10575 [Halobacillus sp. MO56]